MKIEISSSASCQMLPAHSVVRNLNTRFFSSWLVISGISSQLSALRFHLGWIKVADFFFGAEFAVGAVAEPTADKLVEAVLEDFADQ